MSEAAALDTDILTERWLAEAWETFLEMDLAEASREKVAARLRLLVAVEGVSMSAYAEAAGIPRTRLSNAINASNQSISVHDAIRICRRYHVTLDYIYIGNLDFLSKPMRDALVAAARAQGEMGGE